MFVFDEGDLNNEQVAAIREPNNVFLVACPGSGKTRTLTYKIAYELSKIDDIKKWVVAITYTHRAADEIRERIEILGLDTSHLWIGTIHAFCLEWILKPYGLYHDKLKNGFKIVNSYDSEKIISQICSSFTESIRYFECSHYYNPRGLILSCAGSNVSLAKQVIDKYHNQLEDNNQIDFEQILYFSYEILSSNSFVARILANLFSYILIDEYQDTKEIQYSIVASMIKASQSRLKTFIVGDPNQAIYGSLGGYAITQQEFEQIAGVSFTTMALDKNYRSSRKIIDYYLNYNVFKSENTAEGLYKNHPSLITYDQIIHKDNLVDKVSEYIEHNTQKIGISESEICVIAPWWMHLAALTRSLVNRLPDYSFDGPGLVPFSRDIDNFWFKLTQIILTEPSPNLYVKRLRWASDILYDMELALVDTHAMTSKQLLKIVNSIKIYENDGLTYLRLFFEQIFSELKLDYALYPMLKEHYESFFNSTLNRMDRLRQEDASFATNVEAFRKAFKPRTGIKVSTIHGVKGGEYDVVISFGLLQGLVPNFNDSSVDSAKRLLYVIGSRARKNLHLISETGRMTGYVGNQRERQPTEILNQLNFAYDQNLM
ncbi:MULTISPECIES: ATP-dependent helicase [unclassified Halomonas]|uniref:UvrD-helicase domain-containing protein n=1 Tax=unclassified Halomonas TaxID=2609666 RepID=UPI0007D8FEFE|nr:MULTISPECIES: ATP-dependent helicase [unclassified Halomonas]MBT2787354.1 ATP-dependent helicase [Halomonas sp. ISL-106]MBT2796284.1 ATP-dependent helicase [Halomonas sp. ISL-104]OAL57565.1 ATP-dependent DNA helicase [Halomonas sp. ALS9]